MPFQDPKPNPFVAGAYQLSAEDLNKILRATPRQVRGGSNVSVQNFGDRTIINSRQIQPYLPEIQNYARQFVVLQEFDDGLLCCPFFPQVEEGQAQLTPQQFNAKLGTGSILAVYIAKPFDLQRYPFDGVDVDVTDEVVNTYNYTNSSNRTITTTDNSTDPPTVTTQTQTLNLTYAAGDIIMAVRAETGYHDPKALPILWMDLNTAGRGWQNSNALAGLMAYPRTNQPMPFIETNYSGAAVLWFEDIRSPTQGGIFSMLSEDGSTFTIPKVGLYTISIGLDLFGVGPPPPDPAARYGSLTLLQLTGDETGQIVLDVRTMIDDDSENYYLHATRTFGFNAGDTFQIWGHVSWDPTSEYGESLGMYPTPLMSNGSWFEIFRIGDVG